MIWSLLPGCQRIPPLPHDLYLMPQLLPLVAQRHPARPGLGWPQMLAERPEPE